MLRRRSRLTVVAVVVACTLSVLVFAQMNGSEPNTASAEGEQYTVQHGTEIITVPVDLQRSALKERLSSTLAYRDALIARTPEDEQRIQASFAADIDAWSARIAADDFRELRIEVPYVHLGQNSVYWSAFAYDGATWSANQADPTNVLVWDEATASDFEDRMKTDTRTTHRWEDDDGGVCFHVTQYVAMKNHSTYNWTWAASQGLQHQPDACGSGQREHLRFYNHGQWDPDFHYWTIVAAHQETWQYCCPPTHSIDSWEAGEALVQNSFRQSNNGALLSWVDEIITQDFNNFGTFQGAYNNGLGYVIQVDVP